MIPKSKVPQICFKGFSKEWEETKLYEKALITMGQSPASSTYNENLIGLPLIQGNADCKDRKTAPRIFASQFTKECFEDDIVMTVRAPVGYVSKSIHHACIGRGVCAIKPKEDTNFLFQFLINYESQWLKLSQGSTFTAVNSDDIKDLELLIPSKDEQTKIGNYFQILDKLIEQKEKKYQKLKQFKKAMLDKMFPKNGANTPEVRFKGFSGKWEGKKLGDVGKTYTGLSGKTKVDFGHGEGKFVTYMNVFSNPISKLDLAEPIEVDENQNEVKFGDVFFTTSSETPEDVGMTSIWMNEDNNIYLNSFCFGYRPEKVFDNYYLAYMLRSSSIRKKIKFLAQGISRYNISKKKVMEIFIPIPDIKEQTKIGNYFYKLDKQIDLQLQELKKLKNIKKASLDKMFV